MRRCDQLHAIVVERVDQCDETLRRVAGLVTHDRNMIEHDGVILARDAQIVGSAERQLAQIGE